MQIVPESKLNRAKWPGVVVQAVECLLWKCKAVMSNLPKLPPFHSPKINGNSLSELKENEE
jgi:hypothetical protein